ncbi:MAG: hypothetical protein ACFE0R_00300 [Salinarimonas sp.]
MAKLEIDDVDDALLLRLKERADLEGKPLDALLRDALAAAAPQRRSMAEKQASIRELHRRFGPFPELPPPADLIRESREER